MTPAEFIQHVRDKGRYINNRQYITLLEDMLYKAAEKEYKREQAKRGSNERI